jgi:hypothetical protein
VFIIIIFCFSLQSNPIGDEGVEELTKGLQELHRHARIARKSLTLNDTNLSDTMSVSSEASSITGGSNKYLLQVRTGIPVTGEKEKQTQLLLLRLIFVFLGSAVG